MILDATAGNRMMWKKKYSDNIIYIDRGERLQRPPDVICDHTKAPFRDGVFDTIFFDPPHRWAWEGSYFSFQNVEEARTIWGKKSGVVTYYGWDIYDNRTKLTIYINKAQKELARLLKDDGLLWAKWNEIEINKTQFLSLLTHWDILMELPIGSALQRKKEVQTYWFCLEKKTEGVAQELLGSFESDEELPEPVFERPKRRNPRLDFWAGRSTSTKSG